ncbi:DUF6607 family protein [Hyphococcus sp. DH-69]|uniref:DUF6607 family protein n=1 Tax=Hyphococcus formosus TaxID=3143534 RepID=UPI00398AC44C
MNFHNDGTRIAIAALAILALGGCATAQTGQSTSDQAERGQSQSAKFEADRKAILAMAGNYKVKFDFIETVPFAADYEIKDRKHSGGHEIVRVIEDSGTFISLQHILVVGGEKKFPVKHWRQDWQYEPESVLVFIGGNAWERRPVKNGKGKWSQTVYQVDDAPRYGAIGTWSHDYGVSAWNPPAELRPLPRRDATTRDDYHAVNAVNRHAITPDGWVHEQDNTKVILSGEPRALVREIAINTYDHFDDFDIAVGDDYWAATEEFWAGIRDEWTKIETENPVFGLTIQGEPEALYMPILELAEAVEKDEKSADAALEEAKAVIAEYTTTDIGNVTERVAAKVSGDAY